MISIKKLIIEGKASTRAAVAGTTIGLGGLASYAAGKHYNDEIAKEGIKKNIGRLLTDDALEAKMKLARQAQDIGLPTAAVGATILGSAITAKLLGKNKKR